MQRLIPSIFAMLICVDASVAQVYCQPVREHHVLFRDTGGNYLSAVAGWDHVAFVAPGGAVWESHPGYNYTGNIFGGIPPGTAWDPCLNQRRLVPQENGVQNWHSTGSFFWNYDRSSESDTVRAEALEISSSFASAMEGEAILQSGGGYPSITSLFNPFNLLPSAQKGGSGTYTCCGFVEHCAEAAGYNGGEGFVPDCMESLSVLVPLFPPPHLLSGAALSPQMLYTAIRDHWEPCSIRARRILRGLIDPVDFVLTDPIGRRVGYSAATGRLNEIPGMEYSGNAENETLVWTDAMPGLYHIHLVGLGGNATVIIGDGTGAGFGFQGALAVGATVDDGFLIRPVCTADFNGVGGLTVQDIFDFLNAWFAGDPRADFNGSTGLSVQDIFDFLNAWFAGC